MCLWGELIKRCVCAKPEYEPAGSSDEELQESPSVYRLHVLWLA